MRRGWWVSIAIGLVACNPGARATVDPLTPLACLRHARAANLDVDLDYLVRLCSRAATITGPVDCYVAARADRTLVLGSEDALMLCAPIDLDAFKPAHQAVPAPSRDTEVLSRLSAIEAQLEELARKVR